MSDCKNILFQLLDRNLTQIFVEIMLYLESVDLKNVKLTCKKSGKKPSMN